MDRLVGSADSSSLPPARVYSPGELSRALEKQVEARLGAYNITGELDRKVENWEPYVLEVYQVHATIP